jgi:hypothetical protein
MSGALILGGIALRSTAKPAGRHRRDDQAKWIRDLSD